MKKILIYDSSNAYLAYMKRQFKTNYEITNYEKLEKKELKLDSYEAVIFIINNEIELVDLMYIIYASVGNLFVSTNFIELNKRLNDFENITILNLNKTKKGLVEQIHFGLNIFEYKKQNNKPNNKKIMSNISN